MFDIRRGDDGSVLLEGRFTAGDADKAIAFFETVKDSVVVDFKDLLYISSMGLGILISVHRRLAPTGDTVRLRNLNPNVRELFRIAGFDRIFDIE